MDIQQRSRALLLIGISSLLLLLGCSGKNTFEQYHVVEKEWEQEKAYSFTFDIEDTTKRYHVSFQVRNNNSYPYQNLWLFSTIEQPIGMIQSDTIECILADDFGKWKGRGISIFQQKILYKEEYRFPYKGQYTVSVRQGMRCEALRGIEEIGLEIHEIP